MSSKPEYLKANRVSNVSEQEIAPKRKRGRPRIYNLMRDNKESNEEED